jgi:hypothetical protein
VPQRGLECVLDCVLSEGGIAGRARERGNGAAPLLAEDAGDVGYAGTSASCITTGRTSTTPWPAAGILAAHSIASSSDSASIR